jgi:DHA2 family multidrug resistance protein-like MFS transporter
LGSIAFALFAWVGASLLVAQYLQLVIGMSPMTAGYWTIPAAAGSVFGCLGAAALAQRFSSARIVSVALLLTAVALAVLAAFSAKLGLGALVSGMILLGLGVAGVVTLGTDLILNAAPPEKAGAASAISETGAELGGAFGVAVLGSIGGSAYRAAIAVPAEVDPAQADAARETLGGALAVAAVLPAALGSRLRTSARASFVDGFELAAATGFVLLLAMAVFFAWTMLLPSSTATNNGNSADE